MATQAARFSAAPPRTAVLTSADLSFRQRVRDTLMELRWQVREAAGGAEALAHLDAAPADTLAYDLGSAVNTANEAGSDANGNAGVAIFNLPSTSAGAAAGMSVAITSPSQIAAAGVGLGSSDDTNLQAMAALANQSIVGGTTPADYYSDFVSTLGSLVSQVGTQNTAQEASVTQLQNVVNSLSSVDLNDEASSMETLEQSYQAAAKIFTILDSVMLSALNLGVPTAYTS